MHFGLLSEWSAFRSWPSLLKSSSSLLSCTQSLRHFDEDDSSSIPPNTVTLWPSINPPSPSLGQRVTANRQGSTQTSPCKGPEDSKCASRRSRDSQISVTVAFHSDLRPSITRSTMAFAWGSVSRSSPAARKCRITLVLIVWVLICLTPTFETVPELGRVTVALFTRQLSS